VQTLDVRDNVIRSNNDAAQLAILPQRSTALSRYGSTATTPNERVTLKIISLRACRYEARQSISLAYEAKAVWYPIYESVDGFEIKLICWKMKWVRCNLYSSTSRALNVA
jgi:hypothetical protein